jgi:hypothetical protein
MPKSFRLEAKNLRFFACFVSGETEKSEVKCMRNEAKQAKLSKKCEAK